MGVGHGRALRIELETGMSVSKSVGLIAVLAAAGSLLALSPAQARPDMVSFPEAYQPGTIVIKTNQRKLYLVLG